jgi:hypothetical protein
MRARLTIALFTLTVTLLVLAPAALARDNAGQGWYGETDDKVITNYMFLVILFFPMVALVLTVIQSRLDKRKHARMDAQKRRESGADWRGGW